MEYINGLSVVCNLVGDVGDVECSAFKRCYGIYLDAVGALGQRYLQAVREGGELLHSVVVFLGGGSAVEADIGRGSPGGGHLSGLDLGLIEGAGIYKELFIMDGVGGQRVFLGARAASGEYCCGDQEA